MRTHAQLLAAGRVVIARKGVDAATIAEIAEEADVGFGSFYNYFSSKEDLLDAVIDDALELHGQAVDALTADESDPAAVIATALYATLSLTWNDPIWGWLLVRVAVTHESLLRRLGERLLSDLRRGIDEGRFRVTTPAVAEYAIGGALIAFVRGKLDGDLDASQDAEFVAYALRILGVSPSQSAKIAARRRPPAA
jgi:AcrR family transcriptional regulator